MEYTEEINENKILYDILNNSNEMSDSYYYPSNSSLLSKDSLFYSGLLLKDILLHYIAYNDLRDNLLCKELIDIIFNKEFL